MLPTPSTPNLPSSVYPPSEDSYLLLDTLSSPPETTYLTDRFSSPSETEESSPVPVILEVGTGSGVVIAFLTAHSNAILGRHDVVSLACDLNPSACHAAGETVKLACAEEATANATTTATTTAGIPVPTATSISVLKTATYLNAIQSDLTTAFRSHSIDILIFNPPYVPTDAVPEISSKELEGSGINALIDFETESRFLDVAVSGGVDGMVVTDRLLEQLDGVLTPERGVAYVLFSVRNHPAQVAERLRASGWTVDAAGTTGKKGGIERLVVLRIAR